jgi:hypothetical protein
MGVRNNVGSLDWIYVAQGGVQRPVLVIILRNVWIQEKTGNLLPSRGPACCSCHANCGVCGLGSVYYWDYQVESLSGNYPHFFVLYFPRWDGSSHLQQALSNDL